MSHRSFTDSLGRKWDVWTVIPSRVERRLNADQPIPFDRRRREELRVRLGGQLSEGWLAFETKGEKRRLAPIPSDWQDMDERELGSLLMQASLVRATRRLVE